LTISTQFGLEVWFCSGEKLPVHPCSLAWIRAGRAAITPLMGKQNRTNMNVLQILLFQDFKVQHDSRFFSDSRGIRMPNPEGREEELGMEEGN